MEMFLKCYVEVPLAFADVASVMRWNPGGWLDGLAAPARDAGAALLVEVGLGVGGRPLRRPAALEIGEATSDTRTASLPVRLHGADGGHLFPDFRGTLDAAWLGPTRTQLALVLDYAPPLGLAGRMADRALLHRVAETAMRGLLERAAARLVAIQGPSAPGAPVAADALGGLA